MKKLLLTTILLSTVILQGYCQLFKKVWGGIDIPIITQNRVTHSVQDSSGVYLLVGELLSPLAVVKYSLSGTLEWYTNFEDTPISLFNTTNNVNICLKNNSIYILGSNNSNELLVKLNAITGAVVWKQIHDLNKRISPSTILRRPLSMEVTKKGEIYIGYHCDSDPITPGAINSDWLLTKYRDIDGTIEWSTDVFDGGSRDIDILTKVKIDRAGNCYVIGKLNRAGKPYYLITKYNSSGTQEWLRSSFEGDLKSADIDGNDMICMIGSGGTVGYSTIGWKEWENKTVSGWLMTSTKENGYSYAISGTGLAYENYINKLDNTTGAIVWKKSMPGNYERVSSIDITTDSKGNNVFINAESSTSTFSIVEYFVKGYNSISDRKILETYYPTHIPSISYWDTRSLYVTYTPLMASFPIPAFIEKYYLSDVTLPPLPTFPLVSTISPNPVNEGENISVHFISTNSSAAKVEMHNAMGEVVYTKEHIANKGENKIVIDQRLSRGMYIVTITNGQEKSQTRLFVK